MKKRITLLAFILALTFFGCYAATIVTEELKFDHINTYPTRVFNTAKKTYSGRSPKPRAFTTFKTLI